MTASGHSTYLCTPPGRRLRRWVLAVALAGLAALPGGRADAGTAPPADLIPSGEGVVRDVPGGDTLMLEDGRIVRLADIQAPRSGHGRTKSATTDEARPTLERLAKGYRVRLLFPAGHADRHDRRDRVLAQVVRDDGLWLQAALLEEGAARVHAWPDPPAVLTALLAAEAPARAAGRGLWGQRATAVRTPEALTHDPDGFQVVEGRVLAATQIKGQIYLNFGPDWHSDFTIRVPKKAVRAFRALFPDLGALQGRDIRVRGWVYRHDGPEIDLTVPELLELLPPRP